MEQSVPVRKTSVYTLKKSMISAINSNILEWSPEPVADYRIETNSKKSNSLQILNNQTGEKIIDDITENELGDNLNRIARADFLKGLSVEDPDAFLKIRLLPVRTNSDNILDTLPHSFSLDGIPVFTTNDTAFLEIQNPTKNKLYFNIIDIQPDGLINTFFPRENYLPENCFIDAGRSILLKDLIRFNPPFGEEHFKVFVSKTPIDLSNLVNTRGASNGVMQALETVFAGSFKMETRGPVVEQVPSGSGSVSDYIFRITR